MAWSRRSVLKGLGAGSLLTGLGPSAFAATTPLVPSGQQPYKVLEIFFAGALSHRETLWVEQPDASPVWRTLNALDLANDPRLQSSNGAPASWTRWLTAPGAYTDPSHRLGTTPEGDIHVGPALAPLTATWNGAAPADRLRLITLGHGTSEHEPAHKLMTQGLIRQGPASSGAGAAAAITRMHQRPAFVFHAKYLSDSLNVANEAATVGEHGSWNAPFVIPYDSPAFIGSLGTPRTASRDDLLALYRADYTHRLTFGHPSATGIRARSEAFDRYEGAVQGALSVPSIAAHLAPLGITRPDTWWDRGATRAIETAANLLAGGFSDYCMISDGGMSEGYGTSFSHYDSHDVPQPAHSRQVTLNVLGVMAKVRELIENGTLDLDTTLVVFNTEFGRWSGGNTTEHDADGFAVALLGGPISVPGLVGGLQMPNASTPLTRAYGPRNLPTINPTDLRAAILSAAGIHPYQTDVFSTGDSTTGETDRDLAATTTANLLFG